MGSMTWVAPNLRARRLTLITWLHWSWTFLRLRQAGSAVNKWWLSMLFRPKVWMLYVMIDFSFWRTIWPENVHSFSTPTIRLLKPKKTQSLLESGKESTKSSTSSKMSDAFLLEWPSNSPQWSTKLHIRTLTSVSSSKAKRSWKTTSWFWKRRCFDRSLKLSKTYRKSS